MADKIDEIKERLKLIISPHGSVSVSSRGLHYRNGSQHFEVAWKMLTTLIADHDRQAKELAAADELVECISAIPDCRFGGREDRRRNLLVSKNHANKAQRLAAAYSATRSKEQRTDLSLEGLLAVKHGHYTEIAKLDNEIAELRDSATRTEENENV